MGSYLLQCLHPQCLRTYDDHDSTPRMRCDGEIEGRHGPSLLRPMYPIKQLAIKKSLPGIFPYLDWLPVDSYYITSAQSSLGKPFCYRSRGLAKRLGLKNLHIAFSGYWPKKGANLLTRTFKEYECQASLVRYLKNNLHKTPFPYIVASAGNTGNGYNLLCALLGVPLYLVLPETGLDKLMLPFPTDPFVIIVKGDYTDAVALADRIAERTGLARDGGVRNIARRAGLGTVMLHAVADEKHGTQRLFDHYFQAVGSGTGAIAAWEAVQLLLSDGRFGDTVTRIHIAQNAPFTPLVDSWEAGTRNLAVTGDDAAREKISFITADVLTNRCPPYSIAGGIYDMLKSTGGSAWRVNNYQVFHAARMVRETEGVDIGPAAAVAVDALRQAVDSGTVRAKDRVLLHVTGGGKEIQFTKGPVYRVAPRIIAEREDIVSIIEKIGRPKRISKPEEILRQYHECSMHVS